MSRSCTQCGKAVDAEARFCAGCGASLPEAKQKFGEYEVASLIGQGGMGQVFKAMQPRLKRFVCIKTLLPQYTKDAEVVERFEREALSTAAVKHPNVVAVYDVGRTPDGTAYMVMEYVEGRTLRVVLRDESPIEWSRAVGLIDQVVAGLGEAHAAGLVHRDLKPGNVMVVPLRDGSEVAKVLDFGIARSLDADSADANLTRAGLMLGTPGYMAPEQVSTNTYDHRIDLYAAGVLLFEMLTGRRLFSAPSEAELLQKVLREDPPAPSSRTQQQVPAWLDTVTLKALARDPNKRYQTAAEFRDALKKGLSQPGQTGVVEAKSDGVVSVGGVEYAPLAMSGFTDPSSATANSRALLAAIVTSEGWEQNKLLEPYEGGLKDLIAKDDLDGLVAQVRAISEAGREKPDAVMPAVAIFRKVLAEETDVLARWLANPQTAAAAFRLGRTLGRGSLPALLDKLEARSPEERRAVVHLVTLLEPAPKALATFFQAQPPTLLRVMCEGVTPATLESMVVLSQAMLASGSAPHRLAVLQGINESMALRLSTLIRPRLNDPDARVRVAAMKWVFRLDDEGATDALAQLLARVSLDLAERRQAVRTLAHVGGEGATEALVAQLQRETDEGLKSELVQLLVRTGSPEAIDFVTMLSRQSSTPRKLKEACLEALRRA